MLLNEFLTVALIPSIVTTNSSHSTTSDSSDTELSERSDSFEDDFFRSDFLTSPQSDDITDPVLREIYEEERRLNLAAGEDMDMRSEEARDLINFQRSKLQRQQDFINRPSGGISVLPGSTNPAEIEPKADSIPEELPSSPTIPSVEGRVSAEVPTTTTPRPAGRMGFRALGGVFDKISTGVGSAVNFIKKPFQSSSAPSTPSAPNNDGVVANALTATELNCTGFQTVYKGKCENVLQSADCPPRQWLIEDDATGEGKCVENECADMPNHAFFGGKCVKVRAEGDHCHKGMITYIFKNGVVECDCKEDFLFYGNDGNCYPSHRQGPCTRGEILVARVTPQGTVAPSCIRNKCSKDGLICTAPVCPKDRNCIELNSKCSNDGTWEIHPQTLTPTCVPNDLRKPDRVIGNVPTLACAPGSRRDILGTCRTPTRIAFS